MYGIDDVEFALRTDGGIIPRYQKVRSCHKRKDNRETDRPVPDTTKCLSSSTGKQGRTERHVQNSIVVYTQISMLTPRLWAKIFITYPATSNWAAQIPPPLAAKLAPKLNNLLSNTVHPDGMVQFLSPLTPTWLGGDDSGCTQPGRVWIAIWLFVMRFMPSMMLCVDSRCRTR